MSVFRWLPWHRDRRTDGLADEFRAHLEMSVAERVARGESPSAAAAAARREFGNLGLVQEVARDQWGRAGLWLEQGSQDSRFALRALRRAPGFATVAILTIALGIGATTAIFSVVDATLLHPLPFANPEQLVRIEDDLAGIGGGARDIGISPPEWRDLQRSGIFEHVSPTWFDDNNLTGSARPQRVGQMSVAPDYFTMLGVKPQLGVTFDPADPTPGFNEQAVISDGLWKRAFGGDSNVVGRIVQIDSDSYRIIGIMPPGFQAPEATRAARAADVWSAFGFSGAPLSPESVQRRSPLMPGAVGRVKAGLTIAEAQRRVDALVATLRRQYPADYPPRSDWRIRLVPLRDHVVGDVRQPLLFLLGAVVLVLLIGCANVANLLLARATSRGRELAVRQAIGGAPSRLTRQLLTESVVLSALGGLVAIALLLATKSLLVRLVPDGVPRLNDITLNWSVLSFAFVASLIAGALFGLAPALHVTRLDVTRVLKQEGRGSSGSREQRRIRRLIVVAEFALSLVLMSAAGLLVRSFWTILHAPLGFAAQNVVVARTRLPYPNDPKEDLYPTVGDEEPFVREVLRRCRTISGVEAVALGSGAAVPLDHPEKDQTLRRIVLENAEGGQPVFVSGSEVTPEYFHLLRMSLVKGRLFDDFDTDKAPTVAIVNETMARTYWPNEGALGKRLKLTPRATEWATIVGIIADARTESLSDANVPLVYASLYQREGKHLAIFLRGRLETAAVARAVRDQVQAVNSALPVFGVRTLDETLSASLAVRRLSMELIALFAVTALLLGALGIYGVISYMVGERTHEIGVRLALGARPADVMGIVMRQGVSLALVGAIVGLAGALIASWAMASLLVGVSPTDPLTFGVATVALSIVAMAGCYFPARRAIGVDPIVALRAS